MKRVVLIFTATLSLFIILALFPQLVVPTVLLLTTVTAFIWLCRITKPLKRKPPESTPPPGIIALRQAQEAEARMREERRLARQAEAKAWNQSVQKGLRLWVHSADNPGYPNPDNPQHPRR